MARWQADQAVLAGRKGDRGSSDDQDEPRPPVRRVVATTRSRRDRDATHDPQPRRSGVVPRPDAVTETWIAYRHRGQSPVVSGDQGETTPGGVGGGAASWRAWREPRGTSGGW